MPLKCLLLAILSLWCVRAAHADTPAAGAAARPSFLVFDGLLYQGKPDLRPLGMTPIGGINPPRPVVQAPATLDADSVRTQLQSISGFEGVMYLDYELWPFGPSAPDEGAGNINKLIEVAIVARETLPKAIIGFYGLMPCRDYWSLVKHDPRKIALWRECNARGEKIAAHVDVIFPSLYTFYDDQQGWDVYAAGNLKEARRYNKPVYAFLWPEYHVSNRLLHDHNIDAKFWRHQLEFCRDRADGIVIWGGWQKPWDDQAQWWLETKSFLAGLSAH